MILVTGGAGYIGSHTVHQLRDKGEEVLVLDNLSAGHRWAVPPGVEMIVGDIADPTLVGDIISSRRVDSVIHFAAHTAVEESVLDTTSLDLSMSSNPACSITLSILSFLLLALCMAPQNGIRSPRIHQQIRSVPMEKVNS